jgi:hypothetical protein
MDEPDFKDILGLTVDKLKEGVSIKIGLHQVLFF